MIVLVVVVVVTAILLACLLLLIGRPGFGEERATRLASGLLQVTAVPSRLLGARRPSWRSQLRPGEHTDAAEVERHVRERLYGRRGQRD